MSRTAVEDDGKIFPFSNTGFIYADNFTWNREAHCSRFENSFISFFHKYSPELAVLKSLKVMQTKETDWNFGMCWKGGNVFSHSIFRLWRAATVSSKYGKHWAWDIFFPESRPLPHWESLGCAEKAFRTGLTLPSSIQDLGEKLMQHWTEINLVTLQKLIKTMPQWMRATIKAKGGPTKYECVWPSVLVATFFGSVSF